MNFLYILFQLCDATSNEGLQALMQQVRSCAFLATSGGVAESILSQRNACNKGKFQFTSIVWSNLYNQVLLRNQI